MPVVCVQGCSSRRSASESGWLEKSLILFHLAVRLQVSAWGSMALASLKMLDSSSYFSGRPSSAVVKSFTCGRRVLNWDRISLPPPYRAFLIMK